MSKEEVAAVKMDKADQSHKPAIMRKERVSKRQHQNSIQRQQQQPNPEKNVLSTFVPLPLSVPSWPGGLPPMGYMTSLQGVVSMDGTKVTSAAIPRLRQIAHQLMERDSDRATRQCSSI
ncbi:protein TIME FOR COFFEE-like isoform X2 [Gastrolobium bilobum]|uniref:protein TIME FOR COFFEE-like isoform X2 n=1 Tax=Gastrolobium bilobum TaxID=150636 RepID=UPI002AB0B79D|nr:protein TIME FOR COFFEE-like isoform X2 [Gastrolobium bilobum]